MIRGDDVIRGTTPTHTYTIPFSTDLIQSIHIIYAQGDTPVITKTMSDCTFNDDVITVKLTQEDTLKLDDKQYVQIQVRILTKARDALASKIETVTIADCLEDDVLT